MSASAPVPGSPRGADTPPPDFKADYTKDQIRYAPHLVFVKALERLDEAMAGLEDPYPAFLAWSSGLEPWARQQEEYWQDVDRVEAIEDELFADYGGLSVLEYVALWKPVYVGVMRRAGMFIAATQAKGEEPTAKHVGVRLSNAGDAREAPS
jgi:hypothetical protein